MDNLPDVVYGDHHLAAHNAERQIINELNDLVTTGRLSAEAIDAGRNLSAWAVDTDGVYYLTNFLPLESSPVALDNDGAYYLTSVAGTDKSTVQFDSDNTPYLSSGDDQVLDYTWAIDTDGVYYLTDFAGTTGSIVQFDADGIPYFS